MWGAGPSIMAFSCGSRYSHYLAGTREHCHVEGSSTFYVEGEGAEGIVTWGAGLYIMAFSCGY